MERILQRRNLISQNEKETHKCAATSCFKQIPKRFLMCGPHWQRLPFSIRERIWNSFLPETVAQTQAYFAARDEAITYLQKHS